MNNQYKHLFIWIFIFILMIFTFAILQGDGLKGREKIAFSEFLNKIEDKQITDVNIQGRTIEGTLTDGTLFTTYSADYPGLVDKLTAQNIYVEASPPDTKLNYLFSILISWFPMLLLIGVWVFFMRQMQAGGKGLGFGKSKAKLLNSDKGPKVTFADVAGIDEAKEELYELVDFLRNPGKFQKLGGQIPKGCLLIGLPGTGKTLLAKAIAGEANVPFFSISGSDFVEMFVGVGASRVRDMFEQGKRNAPCIIFIDEIDAVGRHRGIGLGGGNDEREQTLNQMLVEMDGFEVNEGVIIIAATNRPDVLDKALLRPGRFDRQITVSLPDITGREQIVKVHLKKVKYSEKVEPRVIARGTPGFSGAQLKNLVNEAALLAARAGKKIVDAIDFDQARDKILMGAERKSRSLAMSEQEKKLTAYHEGGHALVSLYSSGSHPIHKATIIPRGNAGGMVQHLPESDVAYMTREQMKTDIAIAAGGRVAEELIFGTDKITSGASSDIKSATAMATAMVKKWGLSEKLGFIFYGSESDDMYDPYRANQDQCSESTAQIIDEEIKNIIDTGYNAARNILSKHIDQLHLLANTLIERETLTGMEIKNLLAGRPMDSEEAIEFPDNKKDNKTIKNNKKLSQKKIRDTAAKKPALINS